MSVAYVNGSSERQTSQYRNVALGFLLLAYTISFVDRSIIGIIGQSIKLEFVQTDAQLGLLGGLAFALVWRYRNMIKCSRRAFREEYLRDVLHANLPGGACRPRPWERVRASS